MNLKNLATKIARAEGKKVSISIGNAREVISILSDLMYADASIAEMLILNGRRRSYARRQRLTNNNT